MKHSFTVFKQKHFASKWLTLTLTCFLMTGFQQSFAATFTVTSLSDANSSGISSTTGTLRWAIEQANATAGVHNIEFAVAGTIDMSIYYLPAITSQGLTINGYTAPGASPGTLTTRTLTIAINSGSAFLPMTSIGLDPLTVSASDVTIQGMVINGNSQGRGLIGIRSAGSANNVKIQGNFLGTDLTGSSFVGGSNFAILGEARITAGASNISGLIIGVDGNGDPNEANEANLIISNDTGRENIRLYDIDNAKVSGNHMGINKTGTAPLGTPGYNIAISNCINTQIGSNGDGTSDVLERNLMFTASSTCVSIQVNSLGINSWAGYPCRAPGNNSVAGNYLGTDITGLIDLNPFAGIALIASDGNYIGAYHNAGTLTISNATKNIVTADNFQSYAITVGTLTNSPNPGSNDNLITNNNIGVAADGTTPLTMRRGGIYVIGSSRNTISENIIANGSSDGITIVGGQNVGAPQTSEFNMISKNSIYKNVGKGILLNNISFGNDGIYTVSASSTANRFLDYPIITASTIAGSSLTVTGYIGNVPTGSATFANMTVEIFAADDTPADQNHPIILGSSTYAQHGEGRIYLGTLTADANGLFSGMLTLDAAQKATFSASWFKGITSTTTSNGLVRHTSEFGPNIIPTPAYLISGSILDDGNALTDAGSGVVNTFGSGALNPINGSNLSGSQLYVTLVNSLGAAVTTVSVSSSGTYEFSGITTGVYSLVLSTNSMGSTVADYPLPDGWDNAGEQVGTAPGGNDGTANGMLTGVTVGSADITNANFGINKKPEVTDETASPRTNPGGANLSQITFPAGQGYSATDQEDGSFPVNLSNETVTLIPGTGGTLYYDTNGNGVADSGEQITAYTPISSFDPAKVYVDPSGTSYLDTPTVTFTYSVADDAGVSANPMTVSVTFVANPLPVTLTKFTAKKGEGNTAILEWTTTAETNSEKFEVQRSNNGKTWKSIATVSAKGESSELVSYGYTDNAPFNGENLYRLKMIDRPTDRLEGTFAYSKINVLYFETSLKLSFYPNPAVNMIQVELEGNTNANQITGVRLYNMNGAIIYSSDKLIDGYIDVSKIAAGAYILSVTQSDGLTQNARVVIVK